MKHIKILVTIAAFAFLVACSSIHPIRLVDMKDGQVLKGQYDGGDQSVQVLMPNGEALTGFYSLNRASAMTFGRASGFSTTYANSATLNTFSNSSLLINTVSNNGQAYAILKGSQGTVMEVLVNVTGSSGFGQAVTNKGKRYGVQF